MAVEFTQKWVEQAVQKLLGKEQIEVSDLARIKYLAIGETFNNDFFIEMSLESPPKPFVDSDGGDEWYLCLRGGEIAPLVEKFKDEKSDVQIFMFGLEREDEEWEKYVSSGKAKKLWSDFSQSIVSESNYEEHESDDFDAWYDGVYSSTWRDVTLFTGVEVLRIKGLEFPDFSFLESFPDLRVAEFIETTFDTAKDIERLNSLEQLSCYLN